MFQWRGCRPSDGVHCGAAASGYLPRSISDLYKAMNAPDHFLTLAYASFPVTPLPAKFFWADCKENLSQDIPLATQKSLEGRKWDEVTILDWRMIGSYPYIARRYLEPSAFLYYLPSLLVGVFGDMEFVDLAIEGILPDNRMHYPKGNWWKGFDLSISIQQRAAIRGFIRIIRTEYWASIGDVMQAYIIDAEEVWGAGAAT